MKVSDIIPYIKMGETSKQIGIRFNKSRKTIDAYITRLKKAGFDIPERKKGRPSIEL